MGRRGVDGGVEDVKGRWDVDAEVRPLTGGVTTRTRFDGDLGRIGLEAREGGEVEDLDECRAFGVGVSGGVAASLRVRVGVSSSRERSWGGWCNEGVDGDGGKPCFEDRWRDKKGSLELEAGASEELCLEPKGTGPLIPDDWVCTLIFLVLCRVGEMRTSVLEEEEPGMAD